MLGLTIVTVALDLFEFQFQGLVRIPVLGYPLLGVNRTRSSEASESSSVSLDYPKTTDKKKDRPSRVLELVPSYKPSHIHLGVLGGDWGVY